MSNLSKQIENKIEQEALKYEPHCEQERLGPAIYFDGAITWAEKGQKLADALDWIKTYGPIDELTKSFIDKHLSEWNQNEKEETNG